MFYLKTFFLLIICTSLVALTATESIENANFSNLGTNFSTEMRPINNAIDEKETSTKLPDFKKFNCTDQICISKCCPQGFLREVYGGCVRMGSAHNARDWISDTIKISPEFKIIHWLPVLPKEEKYLNYRCPLYTSKEFAMLDHGSVFVLPVHKSVAPEMYCIDIMYDVEKNQTQLSGFFCFEQIEKSHFATTMDKVLTGTLVVSAVFLLLLIILYFMSPEKNDLQANCTVSSCFSLFFGFVTIVVNSTDHVKTITQTNCIVLAIAAQFFMLSFYFWLNVMCFEISRIIRGTIKLQSYKDLTKSKRRYFAYCTYAWGVPFTICLVTVVMQYLPDGLSERHLIRPNIGKGRCWFEENGGSIYAYYYGIEIFLHIANAFIMGYAIYLLKEKEGICFCRSRNNPPVRVLSQEAIKYLEMFKRQLYIFILFLFIWILNSLTLTNPQSYFWRIVDIVVSLQGLFLFLIIVKPKKFAMLRIALHQIKFTAAKGFTRETISKRNLVLPAPKMFGTSTTESNL